jgi:hypothetical protein
MKRLLVTTKRLVVHVYQLKSTAVAYFWGKIDSVGSSNLEQNIVHVKNKQILLLAGGQIY